MIRALLKIPDQRESPKFSDCTFQHWATKASVAGSADKAGSQTASSSQDQVILWPDTFNNYFHPETARAAMHVLGRAGYNVVVPQQRLCCGRPLYDFGMLDRAKQYLARVMHLLGNQIDAGIPIVILEPSCASVFRDELPNLFPTEPRAARLRKQTFLLSEFLEHQAPEYRPPQFSGKVLLHGHCHQKALMRMHDEEALVRKMGVDLQALDSGCCGMAGSFGFEKENYDVSLAIGERVLLPAVRQAAADILIVANGFSCREQIRQSTKRKAIHLAELLQLATGSRAER